MRAIDLHHLGRAKAIATWQLNDVLIDCGPTTCVERLERELSDWRPGALLLTHIHLDHAGAAGTLARRFPDMPVYVHELGAPHLVDPTRLMRSVRRLYGEETDALWGEVVPVPEERIRPLQGGETVGPFEVAYTPGHASHHVAFLHRPTLTAFVGDVAGVRIMPATLTMPHAPPPDIDLPAWQTSLERVRAWRPSALALPHFGLVTDVDQQLDAVWRRLNEKAEQARTLELPEFVAQSEDELAGLDPGLREVYRQTSPPEHMYLGLKRFWEQ